ncbi:MAG: HDIG domain-containing protein [Candidatus Aenigmatarchaeota archaeon]|nr:HDIG domain-containing protein [Candidatus Aenigmarchaeota archaeon]
MMISREEAFNIVKENIKDERLIKHVLAVEAIMREVANVIKEDENLFGIVGLLHDIDFENTKENPELHGKVAIEILDDLISDEVKHAILAHNFERTKIEPNSKLDYALIASDSISGLIIACALILPSKKLEDVTPNFIANRFKQKDFARNCKRERILFCRMLGLSEQEFFEISLRALKKISSKLML